MWSGERTGYGGETRKFKVLSFAKYWSARVTEKAVAELPHSKWFAGKAGLFRIESAH